MTGVLRSNPPRGLRVCFALLLSATIGASCSGDDSGGDQSGAATSAAPATTEQPASLTTTAPTTTAATTTVPATTTTPATTAPATTQPVEPLTILVTNDDGVGAPGIDALVEGLRTRPDVTVIVVAPLENQSGTGGSTTDGTLTVTDATTASGYPAKAVAGFPADSIVWALDEGGISVRPDLVISGINSGQNVGPFVEVSGTVGAARAAGARGIPALAASAGLFVEDGQMSEDADFPSAVREVLAWLDDNTDLVVSLRDSAAPAPVDNLNIPTCTIGEVRGDLEAPVATDFADRDVFSGDCSVDNPAPADDIDAFIAGYASLSSV
jgi:5'-nucleotidase